MPAHLSDPRPFGTLGLRWRGFFAFLGGPIAWTLHLFLAYAIGEFGCVAGFGQWSFFGVAGIAWLVLAVSIITFMVAALAAVVGYREYCTPADLFDQPRVDLTGGAYLARAGAVMSGLLAIVIAAQTVPVLFYLEGC